MADGEVAEGVASADDRALTYLEVRDANGPLVIHNHGRPSSRLEARLLADFASKSRLRLICVDRPGMGQSSPQTARSYSGWADDLVTLADALGYHEFGVTGWSEGGPRALAAAGYIDPLRLRHVGSIADGSYGTFGDNWAANHLSKVDAFGGTRALRFLYRSWAFDVATIERPVHMWLGLDDRLVPDPINRAAAERMPGAVWHPVEGTGHFVAVGAGDDVFAIAAEELGAA